MAHRSDSEAHKAALRRMYAHRRAARSEADRRAAADALCARASSCGAEVIAAFVPIRAEPGSIAVLDALAVHSRVILPITRSPDVPLGWARYTGEDALVTGAHQLRQPPSADGSALADADVVLVPAVAIGRDGTRLGHGGGFYDRALTGIAPEKLVGVVYDDEVAATLPVQQHDLPMGWLCTPQRLVRLPCL